jgi:hypothetical protein
MPTLIALSFAVDFLSAQFSLRNFIREFDFSSPPPQAYEPEDESLEEEHLAACKQLVE